MTHTLRRRFLGESPQLDDEIVVIISREDPNNPGEPEPNGKIAEVWSWVDPSTAERHEVWVTTDLTDLENEAITIRFDRAITVQEGEDKLAELEAGSQDPTSDRWCHMVYNYENLDDVTVPTGEQNDSGKVYWVYDYYGNSGTHTGNLLRVQVSSTQRRDYWILTEDYTPSDGSEDAQGNPLTNVVRKKIVNGQWQSETVQDYVDDGKTQQPQGETWTYARIPYEWKIVYSS